MHSLKKRLEIESQIHKADNLQVMTDNMDLIQKIHDVRNNVAKLKKKDTAAQNDYKQVCTKYKITPVQKYSGDGEDLDDPNSDGNSYRNRLNP